MRKLIDWFFRSPENDEPVTPPAEQKLLEVFDSVIADGAFTGDVVSECVRRVKQESEENREKLTALNRRLEVLRSQEGRIRKRVNNLHNSYRDLLEFQTVAVEDAIKKLSENDAILADALELLKEYYDTFLPGEIHPLAGQRRLGEHHAFILSDPHRRREP